MIRVFALLLLTVLHLTANVVEESVNHRGAFTEGSTSKLHRNGVGIDEKGRLVFAITDKGQVVNL